MDENSKPGGNTMQEIFP